MAGPQPVTALPSFRAVIQPEASPTMMHGGAVNPFHSDPGEQAKPYPWEEFAGPHGPYGPGEDALLSELPESRTLAAGNIFQDPSGDQTPYRTHAGPTIKGLEFDRGPEGNARVLAASYAAHSVRTNAGAKAVQSSNPLQDNWQRFWNPVVGNDQLPAVPGAVGAQAMGFGVGDHTSNAYHKANGFELNTSHRMRRFAQAPIPGNTMWMRPAGRPMIKNFARGGNPPVGEGPFYGQDVGESFGIQGVVLMDNATEYVSPPQPYVVPAVQQQNNDVAQPIELW